MLTSRTSARERTQVIRSLNIYSRWRTGLQASPDLTPEFLTSAYKSAFNDQRWDIIQMILRMEETPLSCHHHMMEAVLNLEQLGAPLGDNYSAGAAYLGILQEILKRPDLSPELIYRACSYPNPIVRNLAVLHPACPEEGHVTVALLR